MYKLQNGWTKERMKEKIRQFVPSEGCLKNGACVYDDGDGHRCAAGAFVPDGHPMLLGNEWLLGIIERDAELRAAFPMTAQGMRRMQEYHDWMADKVLRGIIIDVTAELCRWIDANVEE